MNKEKNMIFGMRPILEAIEAAKDVEQIFLKRESTGELATALQSLAKERCIPVKRVPIEKLNRLTRKNHQGAVAFLSPITYQRIEDIIPAVYEEGRLPWVVVLDGLTDVRNVGAIARTAECVGVDAIVLPKNGSASLGADAMKTSAGALNNIAVCRVERLGDAVQFLKDCGLCIVASTEKATVKYTEKEWGAQPVAIVMGAEDKGISSDLLRKADLCLALPMCGATSSLNVSVAAGVMLYEVYRQRKFQY